MNRIIYVDGFLADHLGGMALREMGTRVATMLKQPVDVMVHGKSEFHAEKRFVCEPETT